MTAKNEPGQQSPPASSDRSSPLLSPTERRAREDALRFATASLGLSGLKVSDEAQARADRFVAGEIDLDQLINGD